MYQPRGTCQSQFAFHLISRKPCTSTSRRSHPAQRRRDLRIGRPSVSMKSQYEVVDPPQCGCQRIPRPSIAPPLESGCQPSPPTLPNSGPRYARFARTLSEVRLSCLIVNMEMALSEPSFGHSGSVMVPSNAVQSPASKSRIRALVGTTGYLSVNPPPARDIARPRPDARHRSARPRLDPLSSATPSTPDETHAPKAATGRARVVAMTPHPRQSYRTCPRPSGSSPRSSAFRLHSAVRLQVVAPP